MAKNKALAEKLKELDFFYGNQWIHLPDDHPDIVALKKTIKKRTSKKVKRARFVWEEWHDDYLRKNHDKFTIDELSEYFHCTRQTTHKKLKEMGLDRKIQIGIRIGQYTTDGELVKEYQNIKIAASDNDLCRVKLGNYSRTSTPLGGYIWKRIY